MVAIIEMFAYVAELMAYRVDMSVHENLITDAVRPQSVLRLAKLISYTASRNLPLRGLVKITSISISENFVDSQGNQLSNRVINWDDQTNPLWREQFFTAIDKVLTQAFGFPFKSFQVADTVFQQYEVHNVLEVSSSNSSFSNGVIKTKVSTNGQNLDFELVPADIDQSGVFERDPDPTKYFNILYADDGYGDASDTTGFMMYLKQGDLNLLQYNFTTNTLNLTVDIPYPNINDVDVWVQSVDPRGLILSTWQAVPNVAGVNLIFNNIQNLNKYEIETLENDQIRLIFGDGDFAAIPTGLFNVWFRQSTSGGISVPQSLVSDQSATFSYTSKTGSIESCTLTFSLAGSLQNSATTETTDHIKSVAPAVYYSQDRMVNGQDYNSYLLQDPSILRLSAVNRTFAGQPKYLNWNDASGAYQNIKLFGDDLYMYYSQTAKSQLSLISARSLIDNVIEPMLSLPGLYNMLIYQFYLSPITISVTQTAGPKTVIVHPFVAPRLKFIEDVTQTSGGLPILEKTMIQGYLDRHWYGEPDYLIQLDANLSDTSTLPKTNYADVTVDTDHLIYDATIKCVTQDPTTGAYYLINTANGTSGIQESVIRQKRFGISYNVSRNFASQLIIAPAGTLDVDFPVTNTLTSSDLNQSLAVEDTYTIEITSTDGTFTVYSAVSGVLSSGTVGTTWTDGILSFIIGPSTTIGQLGDAFIISVNQDVNAVVQYSPYVIAKNLTGLFTMIPENLLGSDPASLAFDPTDPVASWLFLVERSDNVDGTLQNWTITARDFSLTIESPTTQFWYNQTMTIVDPITQNPVVDMIRILKSNLDATSSKPIGVDQVYNVIGNVKYANGAVNVNALTIVPSDVFANINTSTTGTSNDPLEFLSFLGTGNYVYFKQDPATNNLIPTPTTTYLQGLTYTNDIAVGTTTYVRKLGRNNIDFMWQHFTPDNNLIDPSTSNIIDIYVLTSGYYSLLQEYIAGILPIAPTPPSSLDLQNSYSALLQNKMLSDTVVMHTCSIKLIFGALAIPELQVMFKVLPAPGTTMTNDQIIAQVLSIINLYFDISNWNFGQSFYATDLCSVIHNSLSGQVSSVVMVPVFPSNYFGDLYYLTTEPNELFVSCATAANIEIISSIDRLTLKQK